MKKLITIFLLFCLSGCEKEKIFKNKSGLLVDYTGLDGCNWVIESEGEVYEPINLSEFSIALKDSTEIKFSYFHEPRYSICMIGPTIELISIKEK